MEKYIGCSGFHYKDWKGDFYPEKLPKSKWLEYYAERFNTVEINNTFYGTPSEKTFKNWHDSTPDEFRFTVKGNRYITHLKKMKDVKNQVAEFYQTISPLQQKVECVLWQLPGNQHKDTEKLSAFCQWLEPSFVNVIEFRHNSWFCDEVYDILRSNTVSFCMISAPGELKEDVEATTDSAYIRFHGKEEWYKYLYTENEIKQWTEKIKNLDISTLYVYFNNDYGGNSITNAMKFKELTK